MPSSVRPHGAPGSLPGPHSRYQPDSSSTNGRSQRPAPKYGTARLRHQSVSAPWPGSIRAISVTAPSTSSTIPIERAHDRRRQPERQLRGRRRAARDDFDACERRLDEVREAAVRRRVAIR